MTNNTAFLLIGVFAACIIMIYFLGRSNSRNRKWSTCLLCILLFSIICTIGLGVNYLAAFTGRQDGISLTGWLARLIIGEGRWSIDLFLSYFEVSVSVSILLLITYFTAIIFENKAQHKH